MATTLVALNYLIGVLGTRSHAFDRLVEGEPVVLVRNGVVIGAAMRRNNIPASDLDEALREKGIQDLHQVGIAILETDGKISVIAR